MMERLSAIALSTVVVLLPSTSAASVQASSFAGAPSIPASSWSSPPPIQQQYEELCSPPQTCSVQTCSRDVLRGLATTRLQMQSLRRSSHSRGSAAATEALELHLAGVKLEEASVGCALLLHRGDATTDRGDDIACPPPNTCDTESDEGAEGANTKPPCDARHHRRLRSSRDALEASLRDAAPDRGRGSSAARHELAERNAELAAVGCAVAAGRSARADAFGKLSEDPERFDSFLWRNYRHFAFAETMPFLQGLSKIQQKRAKIEVILQKEGIGGQERLSRERAVERLRGEEGLIRLKLLDWFLPRLEEGTIKLSELELEDPNEGRPLADGPGMDERIVWKMIGDDVKRKKAEREKGTETRRDAERTRVEAEADERTRERGTDKNGHRRSLVRERPAGDDDGSRFPRASPPSTHERDADDGVERSCAAASDPPPSESRRSLAIRTMRDDIILLRQKAADAFSEREREGRLSVAREMEKQLDSLLRDERPNLTPGRVLVM